MSLKYLVDSLDGLEETVKPLYIEKDGKFCLDVEGVEPVGNIVGLRSALSKERNERANLEKRLKAYGEVTPEQIHEMTDKLAEFELTGGKNKEFDITKLSEEEQNAIFGKVLEERVNIRSRKFEREKADLEIKVKELSDARAALENKYTGEKLQAKVAAKANGKILASALPDVMLRARAGLKYNPETDDFSDENGSAFDEWFDNQLAASPHWVERSHGGGASGGKDGSTGDSADNSVEAVTRRAWAK